MKWALVPEKEGDYEVPGFQASFFDTKEKKYRVIATSPHMITVLPGETGKIQASGDATDETVQAKQTVEEVGRDILPIHFSTRDLESSHSAWPEGLFFPVFLLAPVFVFAATFFGAKIRKKSVQDSAAARARKASRAFLKQYRQGGMNWGQLALLLRDYLNDRFNLSLGSVTAVEAAEILRSNGVSLETAEKLRSILQRVEDAIFTGRGNEACGMGVDIPEVVKKIEKEVR
jgi:hypothetical protein